MKKYEASFLDQLDNENQARWMKGHLLRKMLIDELPLRLDGVKFFKTLLKAAILCSVVTGCAVKVTPEGRKTRQIQPDWANTCIFITTSEVSSQRGTDPQGCAANAHRRMQNEVARLGGNAYVITSKQVGLCATGGTIITFEAFRCPVHR